MASKGQITEKLHIFLLNSSALYPSRLFRQLLTFGHVGCRNNCLLSNTMEQDNATLVILKEIQENTRKKLNAVALFSEILTG